MFDPKVRRERTPGSIASGFALPPRAHTRELCPRVHLTECTTSDSSCVVNKSPRAIARAGDRANERGIRQGILSWHLVPRAIGIKVQWDWKGRRSQTIPGRCESEPKERKLGDTQWRSTSMRSLVASRGATIVDPWGTLISPQFLLFWASAWRAGWFAKRDGRLWGMDRGEWDGPDRVERGTRLLGVSSGSISGLPGATFPFLLVYLLSTKHRSFFVPVRPSQS